MTIDTIKYKFTREKQELLSELDTYHRRWNRDLVEKAFDFAVESHNKHWRTSGEPFFTHPLAVAKILMGFKTDYIAVTASLLHDVVEECVDPPILIDEINERFGDKVAMLVNGVTKISDRRLQGTFK